MRRRSAEGSSLSFRSEASVEPFSDAMRVAESPRRDEETTDVELAEPPRERIVEVRDRLARKRAKLLDSRDGELDVVRGLGLFEFQ